MATMLVTTKGADPTTKSTIKDFSSMVDSVVEDNFDVRKEVSLLVKYMEVNDCENTVFFEISKRARKLWIATPAITLKFNILSHQSIFDLAVVSNYHKDAGHEILFTKDFEEDEKLKVAKAALETAFKCKEDAPKERALCFFYLNGVVSIRNYLIKDVAEIGPRIDLELDRIFEGCFKGRRIYGDV